MFGIGTPESLVIFGPGKLREIGGALGKGVPDFRNAVDGADRDLTKMDEKQKP